MRPTPSTSSSRSSEEATSSIVVEEEDNKDEMLDVFQSVVDCLMKTSEDEEEACKLARNQLSLKLSHHETWKSNEIRHRLLKHFQAQGKELKEFTSLRRLLDVVLDEKMEMVEIPCTEEDAGDDQILPILVNRCPSLQSLHIHCSERSVCESFNGPTFKKLLIMLILFFRHKSGLKLSVCTCVNSSF